MRELSFLTGFGISLVDDEVMQSQVPTTLQVIKKTKPWKKKQCLNALISNKLVFWALAHEATIIRLTRGGGLETNTRQLLLDSWRYAIVVLK